MRLRTATAVDLPAIATLVAAQQADGSRHVGEFGTTEEGIAEQLTELDPLGLAGVVVAVSDDDAVLGILGAEFDHDPPRVWWFGPVVAAEVDWQTTAVALYEQARRRLPDGVREEEFGPDERHVELAIFAARQGFAREEASAVLFRELPAPTLPARPVPGAASVVYRPFTEPDRAALATLHERLFPGTHTAGARLDEGRDRLVWIAAQDDRLVGYVVMERQEDGTGYLDFLGVAPDAQGQGIGRRLVERSCLLLHERFGCPEIHLTVRASNVAARKVYASCGFVEERVLVPWRRGFSLA